MVEHLPLAQGVIPGSWNQVPNWVPCREPASPSACVSASLCVSHEQINKNLKKKKRIPRNLIMRRQLLFKINIANSKRHVSCFLFLQGIGEEAETDALGN